MPRGSRDPRATTCPPRPGRAWRARRGPSRTRIVPRRCTSSPSIASRPPGHGYEISNWARPGHESRHNLAYWRGGRMKPSGRARTPSTDDAPLERRSPRRLHRCPRARERPSRGPAARRPRSIGCRGARGRGGDPRITSRAGNTPARGASWLPLASHVEWARGAGLLADAPEDRLALTTRGRLLWNELFARLSLDEEFEGSWSLTLADVAATIHSSVSTLAWRVLTT